jgi:hypothetical protein
LSGAGGFFCGFGIVIRFIARCLCGFAYCFCNHKAIFCFVTCCLRGSYRIVKRWFLRVKLSLSSIRVHAGGSGSGRCCFGLLACLNRVYGFINFCFCR